VLSVGMLTYSTKPRGSVVHAASVADALSRAGHDVTIYALGQAGATLYRDVACRVTLFSAREAPKDRDELVRQRVSEFVDGLEANMLRHDVLHAQDCLAASALLQATASRGAPLVRTVHHVERFESPYLAECQRRSVVCADEVFSVSRLTRADVTAAFGRSSRLVPNGVDPERFAGPRPDRSWLKETFGIPDHDAVVLSVGGVEPRKNARRALAAVALARAVHPRLSWIVAGGSSLWDHSDYAAEFEADLARWPSEDRPRVVRTGPLEEAEMTGLYRLADVLLFPSLQEGFGLCVLEAMAAGVAVIVPKGEPFTEYLSPRSAAFVDPLSVESISGGLAELLVSPSRRLALARNANDRVCSFTWTRSASVHAAHYEALLKRRAPSGDTK
jgi:glycosyltransferase-like protein